MNNMLEIKDLPFPAWDEFKRMKRIDVKDYSISFSIEVRHTEIGALSGSPCFYILAPGNDLSELRRKPFTVTKENYEKAKRIIDEHRRARIEALL